jgi:hypothetical protein
MSFPIPLPIVSIATAVIWIVIVPRYPVLGNSNSPSFTGTVDITVSVVVCVSVSFSVTVTLAVVTDVFPSVVGKKTVVVTRLGYVVLDDAVHEDCSGAVVDLDLAIGRYVVSVIIGRSCTVVVTLGCIVIVLMIGDAVANRRLKNNIHMGFRILRVPYVWSAFQKVSRKEEIGRK